MSKDSLKNGDVYDVNVSLPRELADSITEMQSQGAIVVGLSKGQISVIIVCLKSALLDGSFPAPAIPVAQALIKGLSSVVEAEYAGPPAPRGHYDA